MYHPPMQRIVVLEGNSSHLMDGDLNLENAPAGKALPSLLARGWQIIDLSCASDGGRIRGYAVLEQPDHEGELSDETIGY